MTTTNRIPAQDINTVKNKRRYAEQRGFFPHTIVACHNMLAANGWQNILTAMDDVKDGNNFGTLYTKEGREFWLNVNTFDNLPV